MLNVLTSNTGRHFVVDSDSIQESNGVLRASFIMLFANKTFQISKDASGKTKKIASYEYPSEFFQNLNLIKTAKVSSQQEASLIETDLFNRIQSKQPLNKEIREYLREYYLVELDA
ncbi:hypothetical protein [Lacticaseibacillus thailandensis]|uniref:hypothetical protein n=1 Tax=Lacticaseibacillus thailandensis TaxID=381741 RepID=UPI0006D1A69E|nr:hypothetical protein [Lacticaseibacillus thailandensis]